MAPIAERTGVIVVRVWIEGSDACPRARLTDTLDLEADHEFVQTAAGVEPILAAVRDRLEAFVAPPGGDRFTDR